MVELAGGKLCLREGEGRLLHDLAHGLLGLNDLLQDRPGQQNVSKKSRWRENEKKTARKWDGTNMKRRKIEKARN